MAVDPTPFFDQGVGIKNKSTDLLSDPTGALILPNTILADAKLDFGRSGAEVHSPALLSFGKGGLGVFGLLVIRA
jgi:hypothetical protein